jgi:hypothetical protein
VTAVSGQTHPRLPDKLTDSLAGHTEPLADLLERHALLAHDCRLGHIDAGLHAATRSSTGQMAVTSTPKNLAIFRAFFPRG